MSSESNICAKRRMQEKDEIHLAEGVTLSGARKTGRDCKRIALRRSPDFSYGKSNGCRRCKARKG